MPTEAELETMAATLTQSGEYRVLRRVKRRAGQPVPAGIEPKLALFVDVETTGLDHGQHEIIELAMVPFTYGPDGRVYEVREPFQQFRQPSSNIPPEITKLTGITNEMVAGQTIDPAEVAAFIAGAELIIAHNAGFDRRFLEKFCQAFTLKPWACSQSQVDWAGEGLEGTKLGYLVSGAGYFYDKHRAANDCLAAIELLSTPMPVTGVFAMQLLLECARKPSWRIWAENSPFDLKDILKSRGYKWNPAGTPYPKAWYVDVIDEVREQELAFLQNEIYGRDIDLLMHRIDGFNRFSDRL